MKQKKQLVPAKRPCPKCKGKVNKNDRYCTHCGHRRVPGPVPSKPCLTCGTKVKEEQVCPLCEGTSPWAAAKQ